MESQSVSNYFGMVLSKIPAVDEILFRVRVVGICRHLVGLTRHAARLAVGINLLRTEA